MSTNAEWATKAWAVLVMIAGQRGTIQYGQLGKRGDQSLHSQEGGLDDRFAHSLSDVRIRPLFLPLCHWNRPAATCGT